MNCLCMFARYPERGKVKTRLAQNVGEEAALAVYEQIVHRLIAMHSNQGYAFVIATPSPEKFSQDFPDITFIKQTEGTLGEKMEAAFALLLQQYEKVVGIGGDCPDVDFLLVEEAFALLKENDVVIGPSVDGGYYLLGMKKSEDVFSGIDWGSEKVLKQTMEKTKGLSVMLLDQLRDVDTEEDLEHFPELQY